MRLLIIAPYYAPDLGPSAPLYTMLCERLSKRGHHVTVLAVVPHYPLGFVQKDFRGMRIRHYIENGVKVIRMPIPSVRRGNLMLRLIQFGCYQLGATWAGLSEKFDLALVANPALWVGLPFAALVALRRKPSIMFIHDVYPDVGVRLGVFRHRLVISAVRSLERFCLSRSTLIRILSSSFRPQLKALGVPDWKMTLVYDWVDTELIRPLPRDNEFARENGLVDRFVVLYAGNIGFSQGLENVLTAAEQLSSQEDLLFLFVGDGAGREQLIRNARQRDLNNVKFLPFQNRQRLPEVLASSDVSIVSLRKGIGMESLPSKTFSILASGRPVIVSVDEESETWDLIKVANAGICVPPESTPDLVQAILRLKGEEELRNRMGSNGRHWAILNHSPDSAAEKLERLMIVAISKRHLAERKFAELNK